ncbi:hypothetical protein D3C87_1951520 [compost metagenome]
MAASAQRLGVISDGASQAKLVLEWGASFRAALIRSSNRASRNWMEAASVRRLGARVGAFPFCSVFGLGYIKKT